MLNRVQIVTRSLAVLVGPVLICVLGCSDDGMGKRYPVSGKVTYKGQPVAKARISFFPKTANIQGAHGDVVNGSFSSLTTLENGDGALPGEYKVTVNATEIDEAKLKADSEKVVAAKSKGRADMKVMMPIPEVQAKIKKEAKSSIPTKYLNPDTSDLTAKVEEKSNTFEFDLKD